MGIRLPREKDKNPVSDIQSSNSSTASSLTSTNTNSPTPGGQQGGMTYDQVMNLWMQAGGNPQAASMAAAVADASSGLNPSSTYTNPDGTQSIGLWLIPSNGSPPGSTDPLSNARAAVQQSNNGTDWSQWCVAWSDNNCGQDGGSYLGSGSNAMGALTGQGGTYNIAGAAGTQDGTSAAVATGATTSSSAPKTSKASSLVKWIILLAVLLAVFVMVRRKTGEGETGQSQARSQASWSPGEEALIQNSDKTDSQISSETGRSIRAIRVRRNQMKS